jgi:hypothetical protein
VPTDVVISGLSPNRTDVREAVLAELRATFVRLSRVAGIDAQFASMPYLAYPTSFSRSWIWQAVANATGEERHIDRVAVGRHRARRRLDGHARQCEFRLTPPKRVADMSVCENARPAPLRCPTRGRGAGRRPGAVAQGPRLAIQRGRAADSG